jgi:acyl carrier protein
MTELAYALPHLPANDEDSPVLERLREMTALVLNMPAAELDAEGRLFGYGLDSIKIVDLAIAIEDEFGVELGEGDAELYRVKTLRQLAELVARRRV